MNESFLFLSFELLFKLISHLLALITMDKTSTVALTSEIGFIHSQFTFVIFIVSGGKPFHDKPKYWVDSI